jgi:bifunctional non-homologous end joining protein LigD
MPANKRPPGPPPRTDPLGAYRAKRKLDATPEPAGGPAAGPKAGGLFVVHMHAARRLHFDLRLEMDGVLKSWAVPRGPSKNPADKRLAVHVEDHPLEYGDFEGIIPEGNYGAGAVIVWDRGRWLPLEDIAEGFRKGKLLFELQGYKLRGAWTLVKLKKEVKEWLLIKERDGYVSTDGDAFPPHSVLSGFTVEELRDGKDRAGPIAKALAKAGAPKRAVTAEEAEPMLAETRDDPFTKAGWVFEPKLDGYRVRAASGEGEARLVSRNGNDITGGFPEIQRALAALPYENALFDGELVVLDDQGRPNFGRLQDRALLRKGPEVRRAAVELPATLYVFDLLAFQGLDVRPLPLVARKAALEKLVPSAGPVRYLDHFEKSGEELYERAVVLGFEGVVAKKDDSVYRAGRSANWIKIRALKTDDFVVVGYSPPKGSRSGFGALHLAAYEGKKLVYVGRVGSGFDAKQIKEVSATLEAAVRPKPACVGPVPRSEDHVWVEPQLVAEVRYKEITDDGLLRQPTFVRFRDDKKLEDCVIQRRGERGVVPSDGAAEPAAPGRVPLPTPPAVVFTNLPKVFWPDEKYTKGDLIEYYRAISPWLLPFLDDRPVVMTRYPDGINGKSFFQKDAPQYAHDYVRTVTIWSEDSQRELNYFIIESEASLLYVANMASIPLHIWGSQVATLQNPDWCILDLDPKGAPFKDVVAVAKEVKGLCDEIEMPSFIKTSGSTGLHVLLPMGRQCTYEQCRTLGGLLARVVADRVPKIATITRQVGKREGKVYLDYVQNGHGRLLVAPYSVRPLPGAPVSMPLKWSEVTPKLDISKFTIKNAPARMKKLGDDPVRPVMDLKPDLTAVLERLQERV